MIHYFVCQCICCLGMLSVYFVLQYLHFFEVPIKYITYMVPIDYITNYHMLMCCFLPNIQKEKKTGTNIFYEVQGIYFCHQFLFICIEALVLSLNTFFVLEIYYVYQLVLSTLFWCANNILHTCDHQIYALSISYCVLGFANFGTATNDADSIIQDINTKFVHKLRHYRNTPTRLFACNMSNMWFT